MEATITTYSTRFIVKAAYNKGLWDFFKNLDSRRYDNSKEIWSFDNVHFKTVRDFFKMYNYSLTTIDKTSAALLFVVNKVIYLLCSFDDDLADEFRKQFSDARFEPDTNEWSLPSYSFVPVAYFLKGNNITYIYANQHIKVYLSYLCNKFREQEQPKECDGKDETDDCDSFKENKRL